MFPMQNVSDVMRGTICCWPAGHHLFEFIGHGGGLAWVRYLHVDGFPSANQTSSRKYSHSPIVVIRRAGDDTPLFKLLSGHKPITTEGNTTMSKLYQTKEATPRFGILLATNSAGLLVLEMKGSNEVLTFAKSEVEEVKPYTVRVKFIEGEDAREYEFLSRKGDVEVGDLLMVKGYTNMVKVLAVDTKSDRATVDLVGRKVMTAPFGESLIE